MASDEDVVPAGLSRHRRLPDSVQRVHGLLHLRYAHVLVPVRVRADGRVPLVERRSAAYGRQVGRVRGRKRCDLRRSASRQDGLPAAFVRPRPRRQPERRPPRVAFPRRPRPLGLLRRNVLRLQPPALGRRSPLSRGRVQLPPLLRPRWSRRPGQDGRPRRPLDGLLRLGPARPAAREVPVQPATSVHLVDSDFSLRHHAEPVASAAGPLRLSLRLAGQNYPRDVPLPAAHLPTVERQASDSVRRRISVHELLSSDRYLLDRVFSSVSRHDRI